MSRFRIVARRTLVLRVVAAVAILSVGTALAFLDGMSAPAIGVITMLALAWPTFSTQFESFAWSIQRSREARERRSVSA